MNGDRWMVLAVVVVLALLTCKLAFDARTEYRREVIQERTLIDLQRAIDGLVEQVDQQADEIARLETAVKLRY